MSVLSVASSTFILVFGIFGDPDDAANLDNPLNHAVIIPHEFNTFIGCAASRWTAYLGVFDQAVRNDDPGYAYIVGLCAEKHGNFPLTDALAMELLIQELTHETP